MSGGGVLFNFIPRLNQLFLVLFENSHDLSQICLSETLVPTKLDGSKPELGFTSSLMHVDVCGFIWLRAIKADSITFFPENRRHRYRLLQEGEIARDLQQRNVNSKTEKPVVVGDYFGPVDGVVGGGLKGYQNWLRPGAAKG